MSRSAPWSLDPAEVTFGFYSTATSTRRKRRLSRELDSRGMEMKLTHLPTGVEVAGEIPTGHYSRKVMQDLRDDLYRELYAQLETKVARHLRVPGR